MNKTKKWLVGGVAALMLGALVYAVPAMASGTPMMNGNRASMMNAVHAEMMSGDHAAMMNGAHAEMMTEEMAAMHQDCLNRQGTMDGLD